MTAKSFLINFFFLLFIATSAQAADLNQIVQNAVLPIMQKQDMPGVAVAVYYQGQAHYYNFGVANTSNNTPVTENTVFEIASITKLFSATLAALDIQQGKMQLNSAIGNFIPALKQYPDAPVNQITIQELATHTSSLPRMPNELPGISGKASSLSMNRLAQALSQWEPNYPIGTNYLYSNLGFGLLGVAAANAAGASFEEALTTNIFQPLGMNNSSVRVNRSQAQGYGTNDNVVNPIQMGVLAGAGAMRSTTSDLMKFLQANLGVLPGVPAQLAAAIKMTQHPYFTKDSHFVLGLAWQRITHDGLLLITKNGRDNGFNSFIAMDPKDSIGVIVLTNKGTHGTEVIGRKIIFQLLGKSFNQQPENNDASESNT